MKSEEEQFNFRTKRFIATECEHKGKTDLAPYTAAKLAGESHYYCHDCGSHWYKGKFWTKKEWEEWIEIIETK